MKKSEHEQLEDDLIEANAQLCEKRLKADPATISEINNLLTIVRIAVDDLFYPDGKEFGREVLGRVNLLLKK